MQVSLQANPTDVILILACATVQFGTALMQDPSSW